MLQPIQTIDTLAQHAKLHCILHVFTSDQKLSKHVHAHVHKCMLYSMKSRYDDNNHAR